MKKNSFICYIDSILYFFACFAQNWKADHVFLIGLDGWGVL